MASRLFSPFTLRSVTLPNRIVVSPMCQYNAENGLLTPWHYQHYGSLAYSGASLVVLEGTGVLPEGRITPKCTGLWNDQQEEAYAQLIKNMRSFGDIKISIQLSHAGRRASLGAGYGGTGGPLTPDKGGWTTFGPSAVGFDEKALVPKALDLEGMERIKEAFVTATKRALRAGFDWVEVQGGHGFLIHEYLSPLSNKRTDRYGGSLENRMRFPLEILTAMRAAMPANLPLGLRVSGSEWVTDQPSHDLNEVCTFVKAVKQAGIDYVCVSSIGNGRGQIPFGPLFQVPLAETIKKSTGVPTRAVGMITTPFEAENILQEGKADLIALARPFLYNPRWVWHAARVLGVPYNFTTEFVSLKDAWWPVIDKATAWKGPTH